MLRTQGANRKIERNEYLNSSLSRYLLSEPIVGSLFSSKDEDEDEEEEEEEEEEGVVVVVLLLVLVEVLNLKNDL